MAGNCVDKLSHKCGSSDGLQVFLKDDEYTGFCFPCRTYVPNPYQDKPDGYTPPPAKFTKTAEEKAAEVEEVSSWGVHAVDERMLRQETLDYFNIKVGVSEEDGVTPTIVAFPGYNAGELKGYLMRPLEWKGLWSVGNFKELELFGWQQAIASGAPALIITEGQYDACAAFQVLKDSNKKTQYADMNPAVVSLNHGSASAANEITRQLGDIQASFKRVILAFDMDEAGQKAVEEVCKILPEAEVAKMPAKDANKCLIDGFSRGLKNSLLFKSKKPKNSRLVYGSSLREAARKEAEWGLSYPWSGLTKYTRGERWGETVYWGAGVKMGKSELLNALAAHKITEHGEKVFVAKPEEANAKTYKMMIGKVANRIFYDPTIEFDYEAFDKAEKHVGDNVVMLNLYQHLGWDSVKEDFLYAAREGYRTIYLDPITNFVNQMSASEANEHLVQIAAEAASLAIDHKLSIHFFCHLNAPPKGNTPHEMGGKIFSNQFAGSRAMMRSCNYMIGFEGNKSDELEEGERNCRDVVILEDREYGQTGRVGLYWDNKTGAFNER